MLDLFWLFGEGGPVPARLGRNELDDAGIAALVRRILSLLVACSVACWRGHGGGEAGGALRARALGRKGISPTHRPAKSRAQRQNADRTSQSMQSIRDRVGNFTPLPRTQASIPRIQGRLPANSKLKRPRTTKTEAPSQLPNRPSQPQTGPTLSKKPKNRASRSALVPAGGLSGPSCQCRGKKAQPHDAKFSW